MTTKVQERTALEKIRKIVADLGEDSYIGTALDGALELADSNIENDFGDSARYFIDRVRELELIHKADKQVQAEAIKSMERNLSNANTALDRLQAQYDTVYGQFHEANAARIAADVEVSTREVALAAKDAEIIRLKAKLYDLMTA